jgi:hypothetical protein
VAYTYLLRVFGFLLILGAIIDKNLAQSAGRRDGAGAERP